VAISSLVIALTALAFGNSAATAVVVGLSLAVSSTAIVVDILSRERRLTSHAGRASFSIPMLQDFAVIPMLFLVGTLARDTEANLAVDLALSIVKAAAVIVAIVLAGRLGLRPLFRVVSASPTHDVFIAATLLVIVLTGAIAAASGLSMAMGGFVAGILLAETEYQRAIESAIEPFKGLLMGTFFFTVGMAVDLGRIAADPVWLPVSVAGLIAIKAAILAPLARGFGVSWPAAFETALLMAGGGEFAFVIIGFAERSAVIPSDVAAFMLLVTAATMALTPIVAAAARRLAQR
jgi:CPA2 family monovalent cation:H+ antiporter-2